MSGKKNIEQSNLLYLNAKVDWRSARGDVRSLIRRLKENERKEKNGTFVFLTTVISILVISGIIISF